MADIREFQIAIPDADLDDLNQRLGLARFPNELDNSGWEYGAPLADVKRLVDHWKNRFSWREQEKKLNATLPQYTVETEEEGFGTLEIHFVHQKSDIANAVPLLFCHGWPGSFIEVSKILPDLVSGGSDHPAFHVVAPSLPGYGFSEGAKQKGMGLPQIASILNKLMHKLGYAQYATQGGDWGYFITRAMGALYPESVKASHLNMYSTTPPKFSSNPLLYLQSMLPFSARDTEGFARSKWFQTSGNGYYREQTTKPQTIGYAQTDSPVALLAWIYEKLHDWTDAYPWTDDEVCTWISIYWFATAGPVGGTRLYYEANHDPLSMNHRVQEWTPSVKLGFTRFPQEIVVLPTAWFHKLGPVVFLNEYDRGGHFAAWERPDAIIADLRAMFGRKGGAFNAVSGKTGFTSTKTLVSASKL